MTTKTQAELLAEAFDPKLLRVNKAKGNITYVAISEVIARLNRVLGVGGWSYEVLRLWESGEQATDTGAYPVWCMAHVRMTATVDGKPCSLDGVGGQKVELLKNNSGPVDLGDSYKGAVSDALKKAAQHAGVTLDLARGEEAVAFEARLTAEPADPGAVAALVAALDAIPEEAQRKGTKQAFVRAHGQPHDLTATDLPVAQAWVAKRTATPEPAETPAPAAPDVTEQVAAAIPGTEEVDPFAASVTMAMLGLDAKGKRAIRAWGATHGIPITPEGILDVGKMDAGQLEECEQQIVSLDKAAA